jgi:hypothetical protein
VAMAEAALGDLVLAVAAAAAASGGSAGGVDEHGGESMP